MRREMKRRMHVAKVSAVALLAWLAGACGNLTSGGFGEVEVVVATDSVSAAAMQAPAAAGFPTGRPASRQVVDGTLTMRVQVFAVSRSGRALEVTSGVQELVMPLSSVAPFLLARRDLPEGSYASVRTVFLSVVAEVESGLVVDGVPIRGPVTVELGPSGRIMVETPLDLTVSENTPAQVKVDLHTTRWLRLLNQQRRVQPEDFQREVQVRR